MKSLLYLLLFTCLIGGASEAGAASFLLKVRNVPPHGLVVAPVDAGWAAREGLNLSGGVSASLLPEGRSVPAQYVPGVQGASGMMLLKLSRGGDARLSLEAAAAAPARDGETEFGNGSYRLNFASVRQAGWPSTVDFPAAGKRFESFVWNDRLYHPDRGQYWLRYDPDARAEVVSKGEIATVVRVRAHYCQPDGKRPDTRPEAVYDWYLFNGLPLAYVTASIRQERPLYWSELHFLELNFPDRSFTRWAGGEPEKSGEFTASQNSLSLEKWGALLDGEIAIGVFGTWIIFHDGRGQYGTYIHSTARTWDEETARMSAWMWIGSDKEPAQAVRAASQQYLSGAQAVVTAPALSEKIEALKRTGAGPSLWRAAQAERMEMKGEIAMATKIAAGGTPEGLSRFKAGDLGLTLRQTADGIRLESLYDVKANRELLVPNALPLFEIALRGAGGRESVLKADSGWGKTEVRKNRGGFTLAWAEPKEEGLRNVRVTAKASSDSRASAWRWTLKVETPGPEAGVRRAAFPQLALAEPGENAAVLFPRGPGEVKRGVWEQPFTYGGVYPNGWTSLQLMAVYGQAEKASTGLYFAMHDPYGSVKDISVKSDPAARSVALAFGHPAPDMGTPGNGFTLSGEAVWQLLRGDWFDAAIIYRAWARQNAKWWPELTAEGRADTPRWMRELSAWAQTGGSPGECVEAVKAFKAYLDVPTGFHWYSWHQIPFDNDYPHYFPTKEGFPEGVRQLKEAGVYVMPYINGRLWDTRDKGAEDYQFASVALPSATKDEQGKPYVESYGSKESDGSSVSLAVMCPTTRLWQGTQKEIVLRLQKEMGVNGVYIDQIAAASPALCMDRTHNHPLGGGHWWNEGYWKLLEGIRREMPEGAMLTTECNSEPFIRWFDGYLTWHWQHDGQVPLFPAIYGGTVQMFGRAYGGDALAVRMKAGQQLVFGEQIGWNSPDIVKDKDKAIFFRDAVQLRYRFRRYFYAGEMARPPKLTGSIPTVRADWQWTPDWWVTTDALLAGAWQIPAAKKLALFFANVSDAPVMAGLDFNGRAYGISTSYIRAAIAKNREGAVETLSLPARFRREITFPARSVQAWEIEWE
ncbi:MAG: hypothetical protein IT210_19515 [Armatimonadetes bacterium]|nr:hypothetical protein [Armatimonadota bacterium]